MAGLQPEYHAARRTLSRQFANQIICDGAFARVGAVKRLPEPLPKDYKFRGYVVDEEPQWEITIDVEKHGRKIPMAPGTRRYCCDDAVDLNRQTTEFGVTHES